jgi:dienelactone hydrolase
MAHAARATAPTPAGVVVILTGVVLHQYYKDLSDRFAEVGLDAVASTSSRGRRRSVPDWLSAIASG